MSDALALLDGAAARVSSLLMPNGLQSLVSFLRGEAWEDVGPLLHIPNVLIGCYNYTPLAIAAYASLVSLSTAGERSTLVQTFERCEFRVFVVNFMPESRSPEEMPQGGNSNHGSNSADIIRVKCMESVQAWCDGVYGEETESRMEHGNANMNVKRVRYEERTRTTTASTSSSTDTITERTRTQRVLFIIRCCADVNIGRSGATRSRRSRDPLLLLLHDISAIAALCRAREHTHHTRLRFSVLLLPDDLAYGGALLEESLKAPLMRDYCVRLFRGSAVQFDDEGEEERLTFLRRLEVWIGATPAPTANHIDTTATRDGVLQQQDENEKKRERAMEEEVRRRTSSLFFVRRDNLPLCCFLREALRRFPLILHPTALRQLQTLWAARHQLGDVVTGFHTLLCPFTLSSSRYGASTTPVEAGAERDGIARLTDSVDLLNALLAAAGQWSDGHTLNEAVAFAVLYEDLVWRRTARLQRVPSFVSALRQLWRGLKKRDAEMSVGEALRLCVPVYAPSCILQDESYQGEPYRGEERSGEARAAVVLPAVMSAPAARVPIVSELMRAALLAVLPPHDSLEELKNAVSHTHAERRADGNGAMDRVCTTGNNFFSTSLPDSTRVLHVLTAHAVSNPGARQKLVPFALLQRVCQLSDEALVRALRELQLAGMVALNGRAFTARTLLDR